MERTEEASGGDTGNGEAIAILTSAIKSIEQVGAGPAVVEQLKKALGKL